MKINEDEIIYLVINSHKYRMAGFVDDQLREMFKDAISIALIVSKTKDIQDINDEIREDVREYLYTLRDTTNYIP